MHLGDCCTIENAIKFGRYRRSSDCRLIQRFRCKSCDKTFSHATFDPAYYQKKRQLNYPCMMLLASNVSLRRASKILNINVKTVARKLLYCGEAKNIQARTNNYNKHSLLKNAQISCAEMIGAEYNEFNTSPCVQIVDSYFVGLTLEMFVPDRYISL